MNRPNILLITTDQHRGDCLGIEGHPVLQTPYLDHLAREGAWFRSAYVEHPQCVPARRTLMSGRPASSHGGFFNYHCPLEGPTLPGELTKAGYHTHLCGKLHLWPFRKLYGFMSADWSDGPYGSADDDYHRFLESRGHRRRDDDAHGCDVNGWVARPWHLDEDLHFTNWVTDKALDFLERRDPTAPFFLNVSYFQPHQPCTPPQVYWDRYINMDLPEPIEAEWSTKQAEYEPGLPVSSWQTVLSKEQMRQFRAGYYGCINHIDDQVHRILSRVPANTLVIFTSDHGEMLGDHQWIRKTRALEASARVPFLMRLPNDSGIPQGRREIRNPVGWQDIMPTLLDAAGAEIPETVQGRSILDLLRDPQGSPTPPWRDRLHGEICQMGGEQSGMQYLTDGKRKYIWEPAHDRELFFDLENDPDEKVNLAEDPAWAETIAEWRRDLIQRLEGREEGFVKDGQLVKLDGPTRVAFDHLIEQGVPLWRPK